MLKKDSSHWAPESVVAFDTLKNALISAPVLTLPNFTKHFIVETYASGKCIGVVLMQDQHPIALYQQIIGSKTTSFVHLWEGITCYYLCQPEIEHLFGFCTIHH